VIRRDVDTFLRTYVPSSDNDGRRPPEDTFDCPLSDLGLVRNVGASDFSLPRGPRPSLPTAILAHALGDYWRRAADGQETLSLERALYDPGSPGAAFRLADRDLVAMLERLPSDAGYRYDETAGQRLILRHPVLADGSHVRFPVLLSYYSKRHS